MKEFLDSEEFYNAMQSYRISSLHDQRNVIAHFEHVKSLILAKLNSAEPVAWITPDGEGWRIRFEPPVTETKLGWSPLYEHPPAPSAVEGYQLVPIEPTEEMIDAGHIADIEWVENDLEDIGLVVIYKAMLSAARSEK